MTTSLISSHQRNEPLETYLASDAISASDIKTIMKSPKHYWDKKHSTDQDEETDAMIIGSAAHCLILEPSEFKRRYFHLKKEDLPHPEKDFKNRANKDQKELLTNFANKQGMTLLTDKHHEIIQQINKSVLACPKALELLQGTQREQSFYYDYEVGDDVKIPCRIRPDAFHPENRYYISLKTTADASPQEFFRLAYQNGYHTSEAFYHRILWKVMPKDKRCQRGYMIAVENKPPHICQIYDLNAGAEFDQLSEFLEIGNHYVELGLQRLKECIKTGVYKGYELYSESPDGIIPMQIPDWAKYKANSTLI